MSFSSRLASAWLAVAGLGMLAALARVLTVYHAPLPRWDLIACFAVAGLGVIGCLFTVRLGNFTGLGTPPPHRWWPDLRSASIGWPLAAWLLTVAAIAFAMGTYSSEAGRIMAEGHTIQPVTIEKVLSSERGGGFKGAPNYKLEVQAQVPFDSGSKQITGRFEYPKPLKAGDQIWALYAPSAPEAGAFLDKHRDLLDQKSGGPLGFPVPYFEVIPYVGWLMRAGMATADWLPTPLAAALRLGRVRSCAVRTSGGTAVKVRVPTSSGDDRNSAPKDSEEDQEQLRPCLKLETADGIPLKVALDHEVDAVALAAALADSGSDSSLTLYWKEKPAVTTVTSDGSQDGATVDGALVVNGDRALPCLVVPDEAGELPEGTPVPAAKTPPQWAKLPKLARFPQWSPSVHTGALVTLLLTCVLLGIIATGLGLVWTIVLAVVAFLLPLLVAALPALSRQEKLEALAPAEGRNT